MPRVRFPSPRPRALLLLLAASLGLPGPSLSAANPAPADPAPAFLQPGDSLPSLTVGPRTFHNVRLRTVTATTVLFTHEGGLASLPLADLPPDLRLRLGYDPDADFAARATADAQRLQREALAAAARLATSRPADNSDPFANLLRTFGTPPVLRPDANLQPDFFKLDLAVKNQGRRPSCAVFAVVSALEFQNARRAGHAEKLSEEYLLWATRHTLRRPVPPADPTPADDHFDAGFTLSEVVTALAGHGIPLQEEMPNAVVGALGHIPTPSDALIARARARTGVSILPIPGRDNPARIHNLIHALNAGYPVPLGLRWPHHRTLRSGVLSRQTPVPGYAHAVTLVGYEAPHGQLDEVVFLFKNSYGPTWGQGGYGRVTTAYLHAHLLDAVVLHLTAASRPGS